MSLKKQMDEVYGELTLEDIPWNFESPPSAMRDFVDPGWVSPCDAVDLGCGAGNYAIWFAVNVYGDVSEHGSPLRLRGSGSNPTIA
jgi:hypothetical protein